MAFWFIGDVHGCLEELRELDSMIPPDDTRIYLGDLVDRGPDSLGVLEYVRSSKAHVVRGNHDDKLIRFLKGNKVKQGEPWWPDAAPYLVWMDSFSWVVITPDATGVHAGLLDKHEHTFDKSMMYIRYVNPEGRQVQLGKETAEDEFWTERYDRNPYLGRVVYGHQPWPDVRFTANTVGLDTGCVFGGWLSTYCPETGNVIQVRAKKRYAEPYGG